ncbi:MAG: class II glutamine amidotransferase [Lachnospiraceae bacterium]|nr:class II glutamine amidotransferase [Lachnospiraceae bacterium]
MCEILGVSSKENIFLNEYLKEFYSHSDAHPHGWGLGILHGNDAAIEKEPVKADKSTYLKERLKQRISEKTLFAHIRYATIGHVEYKNCHPYSMVDNNGRRWTLIHNGTIFEAKPLEKYVYVQDGDTDSERILLYIIDVINEEEGRANRRLSAKERFNIIDKIIVDISKDNKLNLMLYDNELMYVHTNFAGSLHYLKKDGSVIVATSPVSDEEWEKVPFTQLLAYKDGELLYVGTNHGNEYIENEENVKMLYQIFAEL